MKSDKENIIVFDMDGVIFDTVPLARQAFMDMHPGITFEFNKGC
jgi:beta-phosphoglucomutase-like phosphatase (HAD superfamily)